MNNAFNNRHIIIPSHRLRNEQLKESCPIMLLTILGFNQQQKPHTYISKIEKKKSCQGCHLEYMCLCGCACFLLYQGINCVKKKIYADFLL